MPVHGPGPSCGEASSASLFAEVLHQIPHILDLVPPGDAYSVACTSWPALLALLQYGRRIEEGECEWTRQVTRYPSISFLGPRPVRYELELKSEQRTVPVFQLGTITLLQGLARRVSAGSQYVGELEYAGARVPVQDAAALLGAVVAAGVDSTSLLAHGVRELAAVLEAAGRPRATRLHVTRLAVQRYLLSSDTVTPDVREERVSLLCRVLSTPAVREHTRHIDVTQIGTNATAAAEILGALATGHALETLIVRGSTLGLTGARALAKVVETSTKLRELDIDEVDLSPRGATTVAEAVARSGHIRKLVVSEHIDGVLDELARHGCGGLQTLHLTRCISAETAVKLAACATNLSSLKMGLWCPITTATTGVIKQLVQSASLLRILDLRLPSIERGEVKELCAAITSSPSSRLESLVLTGDLTKDSAEAIATLLASCTTLRALTLTGRDLTDAGYVHIAEALAQNTTLRKISLCTAYMTASAFAKLTRAVASSSLEVFEMPYATFPTDTTINIADLSTSSTLRRIHIYLADKRTWAVADGVEHRKGSQRLAGVRDFAAGLAHNTVLRMLALDDFTGFAEPDAFGALADALRTNTALRSLSIKEAGFHDSRGATRVLAQALRHNRGLRSVSLGYGNDAGSETKRMMVQALRENTTLQRLCLGGRLYFVLCERTRYGNGGVWIDSIENVGGTSPGSSCTTPPEQLQRQCSPARQQTRSMTNTTALYLPGAALARSTGLCGGGACPHGSPPGCRCNTPRAHAHLSGPQPSGPRRPRIARPLLLPPPAVPASPASPPCALWRLPLLCAAPRPFQGGLTRVIGPERPPRHHIAYHPSRRCTPYRPAPRSRDGDTPPLAAHLTRWPRARV